MLSYDKKIGVFAGGFKPLTKAHYSIILKASKENDEVFIFASTKDRKRKSEHPIFWADMENVWLKYIYLILPTNVKVCFTENPITSVYYLLEKSSDKEEKKYFNLYGEKKDLESAFPLNRLEKRINSNFFGQKIKFVHILRENKMLISATQMRNCLKQGNKKAFKNLLPPPLRSKSDIIFQDLHHT